MLLIRGQGSQYFSTSWCALVSLSRVNRKTPTVANSLPRRATGISAPKQTKHPPSVSDRNLRSWYEERVAELMAGGGLPPDRPIGKRRSGNFQDGPQEAAFVSCGTNWRLRSGRNKASAHLKRRNKIQPEFGRRKRRRPICRILLSGFMKIHLYGRSNWCTDLRIILMITQDASHFSTAVQSRISVVYRRTEDLKPNPANPRRHSKKQIRQIANSIRDVRLQCPGSDRCATARLIGGHGRLARLPPAWALPRCRRCASIT